MCLTTKGECYTFGQNDFGNLGNGLSTPWGSGLLPCIYCCCFDKSVHYGATSEY